MSEPARQRDHEDFKPLTQGDLDRLLCDLWDGYQELLQEERIQAECASKAKE